VNGTYLGGTGTETGYGISLIGEQVLVTGVTYSGNFPTKYPNENTLHGSSDAFLTWYNTDGTDYVYSSYIGGDGEDKGRAISTSFNSLVVAGYTTSTDFPYIATTSYQRTLAGGEDGFVYRHGAANPLPPKPKLMMLQPTSGPFSGGTPVVITGEGFSDATAVSFGGLPAMFTIVSDTEIDAFSPAEFFPEAVDVTVTSPEGTSDFVPEDQFTYTRVATTTTLYSWNNPSYGPVSFSAMVTPNPYGIATGPVSFYSDGVLLGSAPLMAGTASFSTTLPPGVHTILAVYDGDASYEGSTSAPLQQTVAAPTSTVYLSAWPSPAVYGQPVNLSVIVMGNGGFGVPTGQVSFFDGGVLLGTVPLSGGMASFSSSTLSVGAHSLSAVYSGDASYPGSTSDTVLLTVSKADTMVMAMSSQNPAPANTPLTLTASIYGGMGSTPTGTVEFWVIDPQTGAQLTLLGTATLDQYGVAALSVAWADTGTYRIKALYLGDQNFNSSYATLDQTIT
jgi:hypothetical protein